MVHLVVFSHPTAAPLHRSVRNMAPPRDFGCSDCRWGGLRRLPWGSLCFSGETHLFLWTFFFFWVVQRFNGSLVYIVANLYFLRCEILGFWVIFSLKQCADVTYKIWLWGFEADTYFFPGLYQQFTVNLFKPP